MMKRFFAFLFVFVVGLFLMPSFDASASIVDYVDLTPEQTLALYGSTLHGTYWNGSEYDSCDFTYCYTFSADRIHSISFDTSSWSQNEKDYLTDRTFLIYEMDADSAIRDNIISSDTSRITLNLVPSISVQGIAYFRQFVGFSFLDNSYGLHNSYNFVANGYSFSPTESVVNCKYDFQQGNYKYPMMFTLHLPYDSVGSPPVSDSGISGTLLDVPFNCFDCMGQDIVDGVEQTFTLTSQQFSFNRIQSYGWQSSTLRDYHYFVYITCPRLTEGYVLPDQPDQPETTPNYSGQLGDISISIGSTNTLLQQILAKLDLIYAKMDVDISGTVNISSSSTSSIVSGIVDGIKNLFVPSQSDILNFRLGMNTLVSDTFAPFADAQLARDTAVNRILSVTPTACIDLPLLDLRSAGVDFYIPPETFTNQGYIVQDNKVKVPLMPREEEWGSIYELLKWLIDIVCTTAFLNMLLNKFHGIIVGKKVVEIEDDC